MWGTIFNAGMIILGSGLGLLFKKGLKPAYHQTLLQALGLCVILLGISTASTSLQKKFITGLIYRQFDSRQFARTSFAFGRTV